jgi:mRNA degradation ribonuclease J1/J2
LCWNVHPRLTDLRWLVDMVQPRYCMPLFTPMHDLPTWRNVMGAALSLEGHWELPATSVGVV